MQYYRFFLSVITSVSVFSYGACAMDPPVDEPNKQQVLRVPAVVEDDTPNQATAYVVPSKMTPEEVINILTGPTPPKTVVLEDVMYSPQAYYTLCGANDPTSTLGQKYKVELDTLIRKNFISKNGCYQPTPNFKYTRSFSKQLYKLSEIFYEDTRILFMYARAVKTFSQGGALNYFAEAIKRRAYIEETINPVDIVEYLSLINGMKNINQPNLSFLGNLMSLINKPETYLQDMNFTRYRQKAIKNAFLETCEKLFNNIQHHLNPSFIHIEATFICLKALITLDPQKYYDYDFSLVRDLGAHLYPKMSSAEGTDILTYLRLAYAEDLLVKKKYLEAIPFYKSVLEDFGEFRYLLQSKYYDAWSLCYFLAKDYENARRVMKMELDLVKELRFPLLTQWCLAFTNTMCGIYDHSTLETLKKSAELSREDHKKHLSLPFVATDLAYQRALEKAGQDEELAEYLLSKQAKALEEVLMKEKQRGQLVKAAVEAQCQLSQAATSSKPTPPLKPQPQKSIPPEISSPYDDPLHPSSTQEEKYVAPEVKEKVKRHGTPNPQMMETTTETIASPRKPLIDGETLLSGNPLKIFYKLFAKYENDIKTDNNVQISLYEMDTLFSALKKIGASAGLDKAAGKGSHKKGTLHFQELGSEMEKQVMTLTKSTYLKPYQIKNHREAFIHQGVVPQDPEIINKIKEEFPGEF